MCFLSSNPFYSLVIIPRFNFNNLKMRTFGKNDFTDFKFIRED